MRSPVSNPLHNRLLLVLPMALLVLSASAQAAVVDSLDKTMWGSSATLDPFKLAYVEFGPHTSGYRLFHDILLVESIGKTFWVSSDAQDPDFTAAVGTLVNGTDDYIWFITGYLGGVGITEHEGFGRPAYAPDLAGSTVRSLGLRINDAYAHVSGSDPNGDGIRTDYYFNVTLIADDAVVPEPSCLAVLSGLLGTVGLMLRRRAWCF